MNMRRWRGSRPKHSNRPVAILVGPSTDNVKQLKDFSDSGISALILSAALAIGIIGMPRSSQRSTPVSGTPTSPKNAAADEVFRSGSNEDGITDQLTTVS